MAGLAGAQAEASASASGFSDMSDSEFLELDAEEPRDSRAPETPACCSIQQSESGQVDGTEGQRLEPAKRKRAQTPLEYFHLRYLSVTDICAQVWCEQQMVYKKEKPDVLLPENAAVLNAGKSIHLARELEDHDLVTVHTTSREDLWAIKLLNVLTMIPTMQAGCRVREFPVFGVLEGVFVVGVIDQLGYTTKGELELNELKTRKEATMPSLAQRRRDRFQVLLYKYIFDAMVQGHLPQDSFVHHLHLKPAQLLGPGVQRHAQKAGFTVTHFQDLVELLFLSLMHSDIPILDRLQIEYVHQESGALLGTEVLAYEQDALGAKVQYCLEYWKGQREAEGVDIEDAWKCQYCAYSGTCDWRMGRTGRTKQRNSKRANPSLP